MPAPMLTKTLLSRTSSNTEARPSDRCSRQPTVKSLLRTRFLVRNQRGRWASSTWKFHTNPDKLHTLWQIWPEKSSPAADPVSVTTHCQCIGPRSSDCRSRSSPGKTRAAIGRRSEPGVRRSDRSGRLFHHAEPAAWMPLKTAQLEPTDLTRMCSLRSGAPYTLISTSSPGPRMSAEEVSATKETTLRGSRY